MPSEANNRSLDSGAALLSRGTILLLVAVFIGLLFFRGGALWWRYDDTLRAEHAQAAKLAHVLAEHLQQIHATVEATFTHLVDFSAQVGGPGADPKDWEKVLEAALPGLKAVNRISVLDRNGTIRHSTHSQVVGEQRGDHPVFRALATASGGDGSMVEPYREAHSARMTLPITRTLTDASGAFDGAIAALFDLQLLDDFYRDIDFGENSVISVLTPDGQVMYRRGLNRSISALSAAVRARFAGGKAVANDIPMLRVPLHPDGEVYLTALRQVNDVPLIVAVSLSEADVLAPLRRELNASIIVLGTVALLFMLGAVLIMRALRARTAANAALRQNEARFHEIMYRAPILVSVKDAEGRVKFINRALEELVGVKWEDAVGKRMKEVLPRLPDSAELISNFDREVAAARAPIQRELTYPTANGIRTAMFVKFPIIKGNGEVDSIVSFSVDMTEQRRAAAWFSTIMDHAPAFIALKDVNGRFVFVNRALADAVGLTVSQFLGKRAHEVFSPEFAALQEEFERDVIEARAPIQRECVAPNSMGKRSLLFVKFPIFDGRGEIESIGSIATDISSQKQAEAQLAHTQRMEAVGQLTGGIAHDFNNLLTVMIGNAEILTAELQKNDRLQPLARLTLEAAERSAVLTQRLLAFGRRQVLEPKSVNIQRLIEDMEPLCKRAAGVRVPVEVRCAEENLWPGLIDPAQLETAILNLVVNSRDAMPVGGRVLIDLSNATIDHGYVALNPDLKPGDYVMIAVSDTGSGMPPEIVARVFEPFFTTKEAGKGTGLGLPTIYGFIKQSNGHIKIYSEAGHGTVVRLYVPRAAEPGIVPELPAAAAPELPGGRERILLVEDDRIVRDHTESQLLDLGYRVTTAASPVEALKLLRHTGQPDLVITDVVMAGSMNGRQLAEKMRERWPDVRVLFISGYTDGLLPDLVAGAPDDMHFLAKPFRRHDLALKVREALASDPAAALSGLVQP